MSLIKKERGKYALSFFILFIILVIIRFPYEETKRWAISEVSKEAGINLVMSESNIVFPFGLEMQDVAISSRNQSFALPKIERLSFKTSPFALFSNEKTVHFNITNGGEGMGKVIVADGKIKVELDLNNIEVGGINYGSKLAVDKGTVTILGDIEISNNILKGDGSFKVGSKNLFIRGISPFLPEVNVNNVEASIIKSGGTLSINSLNTDIGGVTLAGDGNLKLNKNIKRSNISFKGDLNVAGAKEQYLKSYISFLQSMVGKKDQFKVAIKGNVSRPKLTLDGKSFP